MTFIVPLSGRIVKINDDDRGIKKRYAAPTVSAPAHAHTLYPERARAEVLWVQIPWELVLSFAIGLALLCLIGYLLLVPMRFMWRLMAGGVMGALALGLVNLLGGLMGFSVEINPFTAMAVGFLGLPGAVLVVALKFLV